MKKHLFLKIEIVHETRIQEADADNSSEDQVEYNWMKENVPLLKQLDNTLIMREQTRQFEIGSLNIGKDDVYFIMDQGKRINLEHGDILDLGKYKVRVSLVKENERIDLTKKQKQIELPKHQFSMKFNHILDDTRHQGKDKHHDITKKIQKSRIDALHELVPSKSSFAMPKYIKHEKEQAGAFKEVGVRAKKDETEFLAKQSIGVNIRPIDNIYETYKKTDRRLNQTETAKRYGNDSESLFKRFKKIFTKEVINE